MSKKSTERTLPKQVLNQIAENSPAGFILFAINIEGKLQVFTEYDSDVSALALHKFAFLWSQAVQETQECAIMNIVAPEPEKSEGSEE